MTDEERREMMRSNYAAQMDMLGYQPDGNPKKLVEVNGFTKGKWIILTDCANEGIYCSNCNTKIFEQTTMPKKKLSHFCPNCGSKNELFYNPTTKEFKENKENE